MSKAFSRPLEQLAQLQARLMRYRLLIFLVFVVALYAFVLLRISTLSSQQPSPDAVSSQVKTARALRIDPTVVQQLKSLQDNSVSVHALFSQGRSNPFQ